MRPDKMDIATELLALGAIKFGDFTLKSGLHSPVYVDLRVLISDSDLLGDIGREMDQLIRENVLACSHLCGLPYAGIPLMVATMLEGTVKSGIYPRKEGKDYGTKKMVEGIFEPGDVALVIDDVITDGGAKLELIQPLLEAGLVVKDVIVLVDREQGGREALAERGYNLYSVFTLRELIVYYKESGQVEEVVCDSVLAYLSQAA